MVIAKFTCIQKAEKTFGPEDEKGYDIHLYAVSGGSEEGQKFFKYTPYGEITMGVLNPAAAAQFEEGKDYYVEFKEA